MPDQVRWYVVHTYSGYENKVKANLEKIIENRGIQDQIQQVIVPVAESVETKNGLKKTVMRKVYPGYVLVKMQMNDDTWYIVRNTRGVTSFVGPGSKPVPLTEDEINNMGVEHRREVLDFDISDSVNIISGPFEGSVGSVKEINMHKRSVIVSLSVFGRETPVELDFAQIQKL